LTRVDAAFSSGAQTLLSAIRKSMPTDQRRIWHLTPCPALLRPVFSPAIRLLTAVARQEDQRANQLMRNYLLTIAQTSLTDLSYFDFTKWFIRNQ
jgi:DNA-binding GntR family transcriptional regulator